MPATDDTAFDLDFDPDNENGQGEEDTSSRHPDKEAIIPYTQNEVRQYLSEIARCSPLLSAEQERELAQAILQGEAERRRAEATWTLPDLRIIEAGDQARQHMIEANLRLVVAIAKGYAHGHSIPLLDLIQEGNLGLMKAVDRYDPDRGIRFSTYATWWIRQAIGRAMFEDWRSIRLPVHINEAIVRMKRTARQLGAELGREPSIAEIAQVLGVTPERVLDLRQHMEPVASLDAPVTEQEDAFTLGNTLEDKMQQIEAMVTEKAINEQIGCILSHLSPRERTVIEMRYGLQDGLTHTLEDIAHHFRLTKERIRQIEAKALKTLRQPGWAEQLRSLQ